MDSLTQALLGASVQGALLGRWQGRKALLYGAALATLPDLDVLIDYGDAVANMTYHRGFSHSLFVLTGVSLLLAWLVRRFRPHPGYSGRQLWLCLWLVLVTHVLLDAFTSYGTQLWWPLPVAPVAWSSVFIIDPAYSVPLLVAVLAAAGSGLRARRPLGLYLALGVSCLYLGFTLAGKQMAETRMAGALAQAGVHHQRLFSSPTPFNGLLWRAVAVDGEHYYEAVIGWLDQQPPQLVRVPRGVELAPLLQDSPAHHRLRWFTDDLLRYDRLGQRLVVTDLRLGMTGFHPFRFILAEHDGRDWQLVERPERLPAQRGDLARLHQLWTRIWTPYPPLPLAQWAGELGEPLRH